MGRSFATSTLAGLIASVVASLLPALAGVPPTIGFSPTPQAAHLGGQAIFTVIAGGDAPLSYQWRRSAIALTNGPGVAGATSDTLILSDVGFDDAGDYGVVVSNAFGDATSADVPLAVSLPQGGDIDFSFDVGGMVDNPVLGLVTQPDGKILIAGAFASVNGAARGRIARLHSDGTTDHTFGNGLTGADENVRSIAVQPNGRVLIGGEFTSVNGASRNRIARLNADGSLDTTFLDGLAGANNTVSSIALQADGRVLIGGSFGSVNGVSRSRIARLNADGSLDTTFLDGLAGASNTVSSIAPQADGRVLIGGSFGSVNGVSRSRIARLDVDGSLDTSFLDGLAGANSTVSSIAPQADGRVLIGGSFTSVNGVSRSKIARLNVDGSLDTNFLSGLAGANSTVNSIALQADGRVLIGGSFTSVNGVSRSRIARLDVDGSLDTGFLDGLAGATSAVNSIAPQADGQVLIGGQFTRVNGSSRHRIARLDADGSVDPSFLNDPAGSDTAVFSVALQTNGSLLIGGQFTSVHGLSRNRIARLNADGSLDTSFQNGLGGTNGDVFAIVPQAGGLVLIGGGFTSVNGVSRNGIARLNADGDLDPTFLSGLAGMNDAVNGIALQADGLVLIGGQFTSVNGVSRNRIARLNADGSLDTSYQNGLAGLNNDMLSLTLQDDGRLLVSGYFTSVNGVSRNRIARLNPDGSLDTSFLNGLAGANGPVHSVGLQADGRVVIGGDFTSFNGVSRTRLARLHPDGSLDTSFQNGLGGANSDVYCMALQPDGRALIGGFFTLVNGVTRKRIARLNLDGSLDTTLLDGLAGADSNVYAVAPLPDGRVLVGGLFASINGVARGRVVRLHGSVPEAPTITTDPASEVSYADCCAVFHVAAAGTPLDYRWRKDGDDLADGGNISGAASSTLTLTNVSAADTGAYSVLVSNVLGSDTSDNATLTVSVLMQCQVGTCDPERGCLLSVATDGTRCDDGNTCTGVDTCVAGACQSSACICIIAPDEDGDGYGDAGGAVLSCDETVPPDHVANADDCDDTHSTVYSGASETCDDLRNDCEAAGWPALLDSDGDFVEDACDNCVYGPNPGQGPAPFGQVIVATDADTFAWPAAADVLYVRGALSGVSVYAIDAVDSLALTTSLVDLSQPTEGAGFFYLIRPDCPVGSWQSTSGAEPDRDLALP